MERNIEVHTSKRQKERFILILTFTIIGVITIISLIIVMKSDDYECKKYSQEEVIKMFETNYQEFKDISILLNNNETFWQEGRTYKDDPYDTHPWISSPNDRKRMKLFSKEEQETLRIFFSKTGPISITMDLFSATTEEMDRKIILKRPDTRSIRFTFINKDSLDGYSFIYFYENTTDEYIFEYLSYIKPTYPNIISLGERWYLYYI